jgi:hypothetical protein
VQFPDRRCDGRDVHVRAIEARRERRLSRHRVERRCDVSLAQVSFCEQFPRRLVRLASREKSRQFMRIHFQGCNLEFFEPATTCRDCELLIDLIKKRVPFVPAELMHNLDKVGLSDWEDSKPKPVLVPADGYKWRSAKQMGAGH